MLAKIISLISILAICTNAQPAQVSQQTLAGNSCASIPGVGSPILMIANAQRFIDDSLNIKNTYTVVKYLYNNTIASTTTSGQVIYRLAFSLTDYSSVKYIGIELSLSPFGIGSTSINKFLLTSSLTALNKYIDPAITATTNLTCGDLKFVYSSYGNSPTSPLDYNYPGRNRNSAGLNVLNNLTPASGASASVANVASRVCTTANFQETSQFFGTAGTGTPVDLINCLPNKSAIAAINVGCVNNAVTSLQLIYNNLNDNGTTTSQIVGNPNTPAASVTSVALGNAARVTLSAFSNPNTLSISTLDANGNVLTNYTCGTGTATPFTATISVGDFLGLGAITTDNTVIQSFQLVQYQR